MRTFEYKANRNDEKKPTERLFLDTGTSIFRITLDIDNKLRINKIDKTEDYEHTINISPSTGNEIIIS